MNAVYMVTVRQLNGVGITYLVPELRWSEWSEAFFKRVVGITRVP